MKLFTALLVSLFAATSAFAPAPQQSHSSTTALEAQMSRASFFAAAAAAVIGTAAMPSDANARQMDQVLVTDPTEVWETGSPNSKAEAARVARYTQARTQLDSNFAPIKRLTLERKSPVTRLDINYPDFGAYKKTLPGLFKE